MLSDEIPARTRWALGHPLLCGVAQGLGACAVGYVVGFWPWVCLVVGVLVALVNWLLWTSHGGLLRRYVVRQYGSSGGA